MQDVAGYQALTNGAANRTTGVQITVNVTTTYWGGDFAWQVNSGTENVKLSVWDSVPTLITSVTTAVSVNGYHVVAFSSPIVLTPGTYYIGLYETGGTRNVTVNGPARSPMVNRTLGAGYELDAILLNAAGDAAPTNAGGAGNSFMVGLRKQS